MIRIYMKEVLAVGTFPIDFCNRFVISNKDFFIKKCDASLWYFTFKLDGIVFLFKLNKVCELLFSTSPYEKYIINES